MRERRGEPFAESGGCLGIRRPAQPLDRLAGEGRLAIQTVRSRRGTRGGSRSDGRDERGLFVAEQVAVEGGRGVEGVELRDVGGDGVALGEREGAGGGGFEQRLEAALRVLARLRALVAHGGERDAALAAGGQAGEQVDDVGGCGGHAFSPEGVAEPAWAPASGR